MKEKTNRSPVCKERELLPSHLQDGIQGGCFVVFPQTKRNFKNSQACVPVWVLRRDTRITKLRPSLLLLDLVHQQRIYRASNFMEEHK